MRTKVWNLINNPKSTIYVIGFFILISILFSVIYYTLPLIEGVPSLHYKMCATGVMPVTGFFDCLYFSIISQTKVGYGDIVPVSFGGKLTTMIQTTFGYFYLALVIAYFTCRTLLKSEMFRSYFIPKKNDCVTH